jgi:hypothetical protein
MYLKHFGLTRFPFDKELAADELFVSSAMRELATRLGHLIEMNGIGLVTGDPAPAPDWLAAPHGALHPEQFAVSRLHTV